MARLFYAVPYTVAESWDLKLYRSSDDDPAEALAVLNQQISQYPKPLAKRKEKVAERCSTTLCQTLDDLCRWRLSTRVGRYHVWSGDAAPRVQNLTPGAAKHWRYAFFDHNDLLIKADRILLDGLDPMLRLRSGLWHITEYFVELYTKQIDALVSSGKCDTLPTHEAADLRTGDPCLIMHVSIPMVMKLALPPGGSLALYFYQRAGFYWL